MNEEKILLCLCHMGGGEQKYIAEAFADNWIVPLGPHVTKFEQELSNYAEGRPVVALSSGTAAIHLGLLQLGVGPGDEVICQSFTFSASANPIAYLGAEPVFVDSEPETWNMSPSLLRKAIEDRHKVTGKLPKAIVTVDLYGMPAAYQALLKVADAYGIPVLEDAAEALGSKYDGKYCGSFGEYGALSFNGNKMITTSGGGALVCPDREAAKRTLFLATQARENEPFYQHKHIGYNYRLSNVSAAIGLGQMEILEAHLAHHRHVHEVYKEAFAGNDAICLQTNPDSRFDSNYWLCNILLNPEATDKTPEQLRQALAAQNIESRRLWKPMHMQPVFAKAPAYINGTSEDLFNRGLCLPAGPWVGERELERVIDAVSAFLRS